MTPKVLLDKMFIAWEEDQTANMDIGPFTHPTYTYSTPDTAASSLTAIQSLRGCVGLSHVHVAVYTLIEHIKCVLDKNVPNAHLTFL